MKLAKRESPDVLVWPNSPKDDVPDCDDESKNVVERVVGKKPKLKNPQDYLALTAPLDLIDLKRASKVS